MTLCVSCPEGHSVTVAAGKVGQTAACPVCFSTFEVDPYYACAWNARKEEKKARRSRDDDDDDDDDEEEKRPAKKKPAAKSKGKDEKPSKDKDDKPAKKKPASKKDEDEDEDDEDEDEDEEDEEIEWTPRKRQLSLCMIGTNIFIGAIGVMMVFAFVFMCAVDYFTFGVAQLFSAGAANFGPEQVKWGEFFVVLLAFIGAPFILLAQIVLLVGLGFSFAVPAKAEARSLVIASVVFGVLFFLMGLLGLLGHYEIVVEGEVRAANMVKLMGGAAALCFIISLMSTMAYISKLLGFMRLSLEASQPITNLGFFFLFFFLTFILFFANAYVCYYLHYLLGYIFILGIDAIFALAIRALYAQIVLNLKLNKAIQAYIREA